MGIYYIPSFSILLTHLYSSMQETVKSVGQFFKILIMSYQQKDAEKFIRTFRSLSRKAFVFPSEQWRDLQSLEVYRNDQKDHVFYEMLNSIRLWARTRQNSHKERVDGFKHYIAVLGFGLQYLDQITEAQQWFVECIKTLIIQSKRAFGEAKASMNALNESSEKLLEGFFQQLRQYKSSRNMQSHTKKSFALIIETLQVSIYFSIHNYTKSERSLELIKRDLHLYRPESLNIFYFQYGKLCLINCRFKEAEQNFEKIVLSKKSQRRLVLKYLIPCKIFLGKIFAHCEEFPEYLQLTSSIVKGDFREYESTIQKYQKVWIKSGIYLVMEKMRTLVWRNFLKRVHNLLQVDKIDIALIVKSIRVMGGHETQNECVCIISNLVFEGYLKGFIFCGESSQVLVLKKGGAFVPLGKVVE